MGSGQAGGIAHASKGEQTPIEQLLKAFDIVSSFFGTETKCVEACVMLYGIAKHLGYDLKPHCVSVHVSDHASGISVALGTKAIESPEALALASDGLNGNENLGHLILTLDEPGYFFDPNISQVNKFGINIPAIVMPIKDTAGIHGWEITAQSFSIDYTLDDSNALLSNFYELAARDDAHHRETAGWIRAGVEVGADRANPSI